jgi:hypothetical protein
MNKGDFEMSEKAFLLIETDAKKTSEIVNFITQIDGIKSANQVAPPYNIYDIITLVETSNISKVGAIALKIKSLSGVYRCVTCVITGTGEVVCRQAVNTFALTRN